MTSNYNRSEIFNFFELPIEEQKEVLDQFTQEEAGDMTFVEYKDKDNESSFLPLNMFMRTDRQNNFTHGIYSLSAFSGYFITFDRCNEIAIIAYKHF